MLFSPLYLYTCSPLLLLFANMFLYVDWWYFFCYISAFLLYVGSVVVVVFVLVFHFAPRYGHSNVLIFTGICSLMGSLSVFSLHCLYFLVTWMSRYSLNSHPDFFFLSAQWDLNIWDLSLCTFYALVVVMQVMSVKALGTSLKLTFEGSNQLVYTETWFFMLVVLTCVITQMNYLNKVSKELSFPLGVSFLEWCRTSDFA